MKVYFQNSSGKEIQIGEAEGDKQAMKIIKNFCAERGFGIPYSRMWQNEDGTRTYVDVGSHFEFFILDME